VAVALVCTISPAAVPVARAEFNPDDVLDASDDEEVPELDEDVPPLDVASRALDEFPLLDAPVPDELVSVDPVCPTREPESD